YSRWVERRFCPRLSWGWPNTAWGCAIFVGNARGRKQAGTRTESDLVGTLCPGPPAFWSLLFLHGSEGSRPSPVPHTGGASMTASISHPKIRAEHVRRQAIVYIRQSSPHQVRDNRESTARQYALAERAKALGWPAKSVQTIDEDQGRTGTTAVHRHGFKQLLAEIGDGQVGVVLALGASRLARSAEWHRLVEICVVTQTLLADEIAVYDPRDPNDRLLLGVKGTISEAELFTLRCRLHEGRWNKARRGELTRSLPVGYARTEAGQAIFDPDRQVQARLNYMFRLFARHKVARRVLVQAMANSRFRARKHPRPNTFGCSPAIS